VKQGIRQRLVGAVVVIAMGAILWPVIFDEGPSRVVSKKSVIPPQPVIEHVVIEPLTSPVDNPAADFGPQDDEAMLIIAEPDQELTIPSDAQAASLQTGADESVKTEKVAAAPVMNDQGLPEAWSVQVGAFSSQSNAKNLVEKLKQAGFKAYLREKEGIARVLVGPKLSKRSALDELNEIRDKFQMQGRLVRYAP